MSGPYGGLPPPSSRRGRCRHRPLHGGTICGRGTSPPLCPGTVFRFPPIQAGAAGAFCATLGVVLPSFVIILLIAAALHSLMKYAGVNAFLAGVRPCVVAMILATACTMGLSTLGGFTTLAGGFAPDVRALAVFALLGILHFAYKKKTQKAPSPIGMILLSAVLGAVLWSI